MAIFWVFDGQVLLPPVRTPLHSQLSRGDKGRLLGEAHV